MVPTKDNKIRQCIYVCTDEENHDWEDDGYGPFYTGPDPNTRVVHVHATNKSELRVPWGLNFMDFLTAVGSVTSDLEDVVFEPNECMLYGWREMTPEELSSTEATRRKQKEAALKRAKTAAEKAEKKVQAERAKIRKLIAEHPDLAQEVLGGANSVS